MINKEAIRQAADAWRDENVSIYWEFGDEIRELYDDRVSKFLDGLDDEDTYEVEELAEMWAGEVSGMLEDDHDNGAHHEFYNISLTWNSDIWEYYENNRDECDNALCDVDPRGVSSVMELMAMVVHFARERRAGEELQELIAAVHYGAQEMANYLR